MMNNLFIALLIMVPFEAVSQNYKCNRNTVFMEPRTTFVAKVMDHKVLQIYARYAPSYQYTCDGLRNTSEISYKDLTLFSSQNLMSPTLVCPSSCAFQLIVMTSSEESCKWNGTVLACDTEHFKGMTARKASSGSSLEFSYYDTLAGDWINCKEYDKTKKEVNDLNQLDILDTALISCPMTRTNSSSVLLRLAEKSVPRTNIGVLILDKPLETSPKFSYFSVKIELGYSSSLVEGLIALGVILSLLLIIAVAVFIFLRYKKKRKSSITNSKQVYISGVSENYSSGSTELTGVYYNCSSRSDLFQAQKNGSPYKFNPQMPLNDQSNALEYNSKYEICREDFIMGQNLGSGNFGCVFEGEVFDLFYPGSKTKTAIKTVNNSLDGSQLSSLLCEIKILAKIDAHMSLVSILGAYTTGVEGPCLLLEFCHRGDLKSHLVKSKDQLSVASPDSPESRRLLEWTYSIAVGLEYLASKSIMHGDLAARNVLIDQDFIAKISDFGLSKTFYDQYRYKKTNRQYVPWKWMAMEYLVYGDFRINSDVWSYGIVLWEIFSLGQEPYPGEQVKDVLSKLKSGFRLNAPDMMDKLGVKEEIFDNLMTSCWDEDPKSRISSKEIVELLEECLNSQIIKKYKDQSMRYDMLRACRLKSTKVTSQDYFKIIEGFKETEEDETPPPPPSGYVTIEQAIADGRA